MARIIRTLLALATLAVLGTTVFAQATSGRISGAVKDTQGGLLPGATVTVTQTQTGFTRTATSGPSGEYVLVALPLGPYTVAAEMQGFKKVSRSGFVLVADGRLTADFTLDVGGINELVEVTVEGETVNTVSGEVARTVDRGQVEDLAFNGRNYMQIATLIPGAPLLNDNALDIMTGLGINTSINGSRQNATLLTVDGGFNMDAGSNNSIISNVGIDFIEEVSIKTANFSAEYGRNSGAAINVVTKAGTNRFHGSAYEYNRDESLDANNYFSNATGVPKAELKYNNYGWTLGGPIMRDKLFFYAGMEWKSIDRFTSPTFRTLPSSAMRAGNFSHLSTPLIDPVTRQPFPGNIIPPSRITADGQAVAAVYAAMAQQAVSYTDTATPNNALFQDANPFDYRQEMLRLDYQVNDRHRLTARMLLDHYDLIAPYGTFIDSQLPTIPTNRKRPGRNIQVSHTWNASSSVVNEAKFTYSGNGQIIPPVGEAWLRSTYGFQFPQLYAGGGTYEDSIPNVDMSGYATFRGANGYLMSPTWDYAFSDNLTWLTGDHTLKFGGLVVYNQKDQNGRSEYPGYVNFATSGNSRTTGNAFADALLGNFRTYREAQLDPIGYFRFWQLEAFVTDAWRIRRNLSVEVGLRYQVHVPTMTLGNNSTSFDPSRYNPAQAVTVLTNGTIVPGTGNRYNGLVRPGDVPSDQVANVPNANDPVVQAIPFADNRGYYPTRHLLAPRFSFAWTPGGDGKTAVRGGIGLFYDRMEGNLYFSLPNNPPFSLSSEYQNGNLANPGGGTAAALAPWGTINALDPDLQVPRVWNYSVGVQRELPWWGLFGEVAYVGSYGQNLLRQPDINAASFEDLGANAAGPKYNTNYLRPYKGYSTISMRLSDAHSEYNALQVFLSKRKGDLQFTLNYTYSAARDNGSGNGDGVDISVDYDNLDYNWGPSNEDRPHIFVATWSYRLPFFKNDRGFKGQLLGGWQVSGITRYQSGAPFSVSGTTSIGTRRADYLGGDPYLPENQRIDPATGNVQWLNTAAFATAPEDRPGNSGRNQFRGPSYTVWDLSIRKQFRIKGDVRLMIQADLFNAFNQVNFRNPSTTVTSSNFGLITSAAPSRNVQLGARLMF